MTKCSICNRRWFFSSKVKCNCKAEQLKVRAAALPVRRSIQNNNDIALFAMHQQETLKQQHSDFSEPCRTELPSSGFRSFDLSASHCNSLHDSSSSSSYDSGSTSSSSWD